jgi:hypothetical protein
MRGAKAKALQSINGTIRASCHLLQCGTSNAGVDFIRSRRHSENIEAHGGHGLTVMAILDFESLARELHASDIHLGLQTAADGMMVWIADKYGRRREDTVINFERKTGAWDPSNTASEWAHAMALKLFPSSPYAQNQRRLGTQRRK